MRNPEGDRRDDPGCSKAAYYDGPRFGGFHDDVAHEPIIPLDADTKFFTVMQLYPRSGRVPLSWQVVAC